jgi:hypothetical protein
VDLVSSVCSAIGRSPKLSTKKNKESSTLMVQCVGVRGRKTADMTEEMSVHINLIICDQLVDCFLSTFLQELKSEIEATGSMSPGSFSHLGEHCTAPNQNLLPARSVFTFSYFLCTFFNYIFHKTENRYFIPQ